MAPILEAFSAPITSQNFLPARIPNPKPWQRVAVPASNPAKGEVMIWKRVAIPPSVHDSKYADAVSELDTQGLGPRKRARKATYVTAWGDARWAAGVKNTIDGKWDLVEARAAVSAAKAQQKVSLNFVQTSKPTTFPEEGLVCIPRKRHSSRNIVTPPKPSAPMIADMQPLIEFDTPLEELESLAQSAIVEQADDQQMRRRSVRRMSRRITLAPIEEVGGEEPAIVLSPGKTSMPFFSSPLKRRVSMTPRKVAMSPVSKFTLTATPSKTILEEAEPQTQPPTPAALETPSAAGLPALATPQTRRTNPTLPSPATCDRTLPLLFDQPLPDIVEEPAYEARRRVSMNKARRTERRSSGVQRLFTAMRPAQIPSRRHSFMPNGANSTGAKDRRHTLDFNATELRIEVTGPEEDTVMPTTEASAHLVNSSDVKSNGSTIRTQSAKHPSDVAVDVDMRTNLDIFGQSPTLPSQVTASHTGLVNILHDPRPFELEAVIAHREHSESEQTRVETDALGCVLPDSAPALSANPASPREAITEQATTLIAESATTQQKGPTTSPLGPAPESNNNSIMEPFIVTASAASSESPLKGEMDLDAAPANAAGQEFDNSPLSGVSHSSSAESCLESSKSSALEPSIDNTVPLPIIGSPSHGSSGYQASASPTALEAESVPEQEVLTRPDTSSPEHPSEHNNDLQGSSTTGSSQIVTMTVDPAALDTIMSDVHDKDTKFDMNTFTLPSTPPQAPIQHQTATSAAKPRDEFEIVIDSPPISGFTPINGRSCLSPSLTPPPTEPEEATVTMTVEVDAVGLEDYAAVESLPEDKSGEQRLSLHDDSETEMLRKFVKRVKADKTAKSAAAALKRPKRRSGSTGSTTSSGSPVSRKEPATIVASTARMPLGEKDTNMSPSPSKKRKAKDDNTRLVKPDLDDISPPRPKRQRKKMEAEGDGVFNPEFQKQQSKASEDQANAAAVTQDGPQPRRSTRKKSTRVQLKTNAQTANGALSLIPVRLPGQLDMGNDDTFTTGLTQVNEQKILAAQTTKNTKKNRGVARYPSHVLDNMADDPNWRAKEESFGDGEAGRKEKGKKKGKGKTVRWDDVLARYQDDDTEPAAVDAIVGGLMPDERAAMLGGNGVSAQLEADDANEMLEVIMPEISHAATRATRKRAAIANAAPALAPAPVRETEAAPKPAPTQNENERKTVSTATRSGARASKLQQPTPRKALVSSSSNSANTTAAPKSSVKMSAKSGIKKPTALPKALPKATGKTASAGSVTPAPAPVRMAARRTKVPSLGMGVNGTPAPKRKGRGI